jgi:hypothetical protein
MLKKILIGTGITLVVLIVTLIVHIYLVTRPDPNQPMMALARIDFEQDISPEDAKLIQSWLVKQEGVGNALCNPETEIAVFSFDNNSVKADAIIASFFAATDFKGARYLPNPENLANGCPIKPDSFWYKVMSYFM